MNASRDTLLIFDEDMIAHDPGPGHPESPARLRAIGEMLARRPVAGTRTVRAPEGDLHDIERVHGPRLVAQIEAARGQHATLDPDTHMSEGSAHAARLAAGAAVQAVDAVIEGTARNAFAFVRPPGHHAEPARAMGFCLYNNVAIAAARARAVHGVERVLIVDWDVHHGNGTQAAFYDAADVLFFSTHQFPFYPGTGALHEGGRGAGQGRTVNVPFSRAATDGDYVRVFDEVLTPIADAFAPQLVLVSAGFDAHARDPLGGMELSADGYAQLCDVVRGIAHRHAEDRLVLLLEGGYDLDALADSAHACVEILAGAAGPGLHGRPTLRGEETLRAVRSAQKPHWPTL
jgi:acetoin utilization deacetylase AcuC-like enzyme